MLKEHVARNPSKLYLWIYLTLVKNAKFCVTSTPNLLCSSCLNNFILGAGARSEPSLQRGSTNPVVLQKTDDIVSSACRFLSSDISTTAAGCCDSADENIT